MSESQNAFGLEVLDRMELRVDYRHTPKQLLAAGRYTDGLKAWKISEAPPRDSEVMCEVQRVLFTESLSVQDATLVVANEGVRFLDLTELLTLGATFPALQSECSILALAKEYMVRDKTVYPSLGMGFRGRSFWGSFMSDGFKLKRGRTFFTISG